MKLNIQELRLSKRMSQSELAEKLGINPSTVSKWESGVSFPSPRFQRQLDKILNEPNEVTLTSIIDSHLVIDRKRNINGSWRTRWSYFIDGNKTENQDIVKINTNGLLIEGSGENKEFQYKLWGHVTTDGLFSGFWISIKPTTKHHGTFVIQVDRNGKRAKGMWLGTHEGELPILNGAWLWEKDLSSTN